MLLAEELVLLALDPDGTLARGASNQSAVVIGVTGALVAELALDGHLDLDDGRIRLTGTRPTDPMLAQALDNVEPHQGKKLKSRLAAIKHSGWTEVVDGLIERGVVGREKEPLRATRHPVLDETTHAEVLGRLRAAAAGTGEVEPRTAVILALSGPCYLLEVVAPDKAGHKHARQRIDHAVDLVPAAGAVKSAIEATQVAVMTAVIASTTVTAASSG